MSYEFYKVLHIVGLVVTVFGLFGLASILWNDNQPKPNVRKAFMIAHGVGMVILIVAGFGLAARMGFAAQLPKWVYAKLAVWLFLGAILSLIKRKPQQSGIWIVGVFVLVTAAITLAVTKPF